MPAMNQLPDEIYEHVYRVPYNPGLALVPKSQPKPPRSKPSQALLLSVWFVLISTLTVAAAWVAARL